MGDAAVRENQSDIAALQAGLKARKPSRTLRSSSALHRWYRRLLATRFRLIFLRKLLPTLTPQTSIDACSVPRVSFVSGIL